MLVQSSSPMARISKLQITTTSPLFSGEVGQGYLFAFNAINGILPYTWSTSGPIPAGMILNPSTGALMGTPSASFSNVFPVTVMDALGSTATANFGLTIVSALSITTSSPLTAAIQGVLYSNTFTESGGIPPFVWSFNGAPTGSNTWGLSGPTLSGTPANAETDIIPVRVTDSLGALAQGNFSLTVQAVQVATPTFSPAAGTYATSQLITISCSTAGSTIYYTKDGSTPSVIGGAPQGTTQQYSSQVLVSATETLKAIGTAAGMTTSAVGTATYTITPTVPLSLIKFAPGFTAVTGVLSGIYDGAPGQWSGDIAQLATNPTKVLNPTATGYMPAHAVGSHWRNIEDCTQPTFLNNPAAIATQYPIFPQWVSQFNALQAQFPTTGAYLFIYINTHEYTQNFTPANIVNHDMSQYYPKYLVNGNPTLPNSYGSSSHTTYTLQKPYPTVNQGCGFALSGYDGTKYELLMPATHDPAVAQAQILMRQAWSQYPFTVTAGPLAGQSFTPDTCPYMHGWGTADEDSISFIPANSDPLNPPAFTNSSNQPTPANYHGNINKIIQAANAAMPHTPWVVCESFGFQGGGSNGQDTNASMAAVVNANLSPFTGQSTNVPWVFGQADMWQTAFAATSPQASQGQLGFLGLASGTATTTPVPTAQSLQGQAAFCALFEPLDFSFAHGGLNNNNAAAVNACIASAFGTALANGKPLSQYVMVSMCDENETRAAWTAYIQPTVAASAQPSELLPVKWMPVLTGLTGSASGTTINLSWTALTMWMGRGLSYNAYIDGVLAGNSTTGSISVTGVANGTHNCQVACVNANGVGTMSAAFPVTVGTPRYLGINSNQLSYFTLEQPLLNIMKMAAVTAAFGNTGLCGNWLTSNVGTSETNEEPYLQLDSSGWPTSLVAGNGFGGVQQFTFAQTWIFSTLNPPNGYSALPPGASQWFPWTGITYQAQIQGAGTIKFAGASAITALTGGANLSISGTQIISTLGIGQTATISFTIGPNGLQLQVTAVNSTSNNIKIPYIIDQSQLAAYNAGEILSKNFKAAMTGRSTAKVFSCLRNLGLQNTTQQEYTLSFTGNLALNATTGTLSSLVVQGATYTTWPFYTGSRKVVFATGQVVNMSGTFGSASVTWDVPLSAAITTAAVGAMAMLSKTSGWSERTLVGDMTWAGTSGAPLEAIIQISNELGIDSWLLVPAMLPTVDSTYLPNLAALVFNGTGANIANWNVSSFAGLATAQRAYVEYSNETWNYGAHYEEAFFVTMMCVPAGFFAIQGQFYGSQEFHGVQTAGIGDAFFAVYGAAMTSRVGVVMMNQSGVGNGSGFMTIAMNTPDWTSRAYTHHIYGYGCAPYFGPTYIDGNSNMSSGDAGTIAALATPVNELFSLAYTNHGASGNTYSSLPTNGYLGKALAGVTAYIAAFAGQPWQALPFVCYEGGLDVGNYSGNGAIGTSLTAMIRDIRAEYLNNDPTHLLSASGTGYLPGLKANGVAFFNTLGSAGIEWGQFEVLTQIESMPPYTNSPRYLGDYNFAIGN